MKYLLSLIDFETMDTAHIYVFAPVADGTVIGWGHDERQADGIRKWTVLSCNDARYSA